MSFSEDRFAGAIVSGGVYPELAEKIATSLNSQLVDIELKRFASGERYVRFRESVRGRHLFVVQSFAESNGYSLNDALMEVLLIVDAAKRSSVGEITVVFPIFPYARQDRRALSREPISVAVVIRTLESMGVDRIISVDLHSPQTQAVFSRPFDHLIAQPTILAEMKKVIRGKKEHFVVVSPDAGRAKESEFYAQELGVDLVHMPKSRNRHDSAKIHRPAKLEGVLGKSCILIDDMIDTGGTLITAADVLKRSGANDIIVCATHGILSGSAVEKIRESAIDRLYLVDTLPQYTAKKVLGEKLHILSVAPLIAESLRRVASGDSLFDIFDGRNYK